MRSVKNGLQNTRQSQDTTGDQVPFETPGRSHSIAICRHGREKDKRIATHYCKTRRFDAPVPMHKLPQHTQTSIALQHTTVQHIALMHQFQCTKCINTCKTQNHNSTASTKKRKSHLEPSVTLRGQFEPDSTLKRRRLRPSRARTYFSLQRKLRLRKKDNVPCKS